MDFEVGTVVYAKLRGYPWWPARIEKEGNLPKEVHSKKPKGQVTSVKFFGTKDYGWVNKDDLKPFVQNEAEESLEKMKNSKRTNKLLEKSIRDAFDPSSLDEDNSSMDTDDFNHDNGSSPNNENDEENSNKSSLSSSTSPKTTTTVRNKTHSKGRKITKISSATTTTNVRKRKGRQPSDTSNDLNNGGKSSKKRKANNSGATGSSHNYDYDDDDDDDDDDGKGEANSMDVDENNVKTEKSTNIAQESNDSSEHQAESSAHDHSSPIENQESSTSAAARSNKSSEHEKLEKKLLRLRRRLQRLVLKDEGIEPQDVEKVNEIFEEIEKFPVSVPMLRGTKVGKLMREISRKKFDYDPSNIVGKSTDLISRWQTLLEDNNNFIIQIDNAPSPKDEASTSTLTNHGDQSPIQASQLAKDTNDITTTTIDTIDDGDVAKDDHDVAKNDDVTKDDNNVAKGDDDNSRVTCHEN